MLRKQETASSAYYAWRHYHPNEANDPRAVWAAAYKAGGRAAISNSIQLSNMTEQLQDLLALLQDGVIEQEVIASDRRQHLTVVSRYDDDDVEVAF
jgi:hypothetical protein